MFNGSQEKTFIDKLLSKEDVERIRDLIRKPRLKREEILEILYLLGSTESKLLNYDANDRYVILKFFVWIREFVKITELLFDYQDDLIKKENTCKNCNADKDKCECGKFTPQLVMSPQTKKLLFNTERHIEHISKFLVDLYLNIARTTLSLNATGFIELLKNKYELQYRQQGVDTPLENKKGWLDKAIGR